MKYLKFILFFVVFSNVSYSQSGWVSQQIGADNYIGIVFYNSNSGLIFGQSGTILKTTNKGVNWNTCISNAPGPVKFGHALSDSVIGLIINEGGSFGYPAFFTTNAGLNWVRASIQPSGSGLVFLTTIYFIDRLNAYTCGSFFTFKNNRFGPEGIIYKTTNGGINWSQSLRTGVDYSDIKFLNQNTGAVFGGSSLLRTTNSGANWQLISSAAVTGRMSNPFLDTFYICDNYNIARTTNYGLTFTIQQANNQKPLRGAYFTNGKYGFAVGDSGTIIKTSNAGVNWIAQNSTTIQNINGVWFLNKDTGFAVCNNGIILKTFSGGVSNIKVINSEIPENYVLLQNYPNPFNHNTIIKFSIPLGNGVGVRNGVILKVYDITGKEVTIQVNEALQPGTYEVTFDGRKFASGVYFYTLSTGTYRETKRMLLVK
jgi:photosystem II stability/assembly factor-like uncharacterized protein